MPRAQDGLLQVLGKSSARADAVPRGGEGLAGHMQQDQEQICYEIKPGPARLAKPGFFLPPLSPVGPGSDIWQRCTDSRAFLCVAMEMGPWHPRKIIFLCRSFPYPVVFTEAQNTRHAHSHSDLSANGSNCLATPHENEPVTRQHLRLTWAAAWLPCRVGEGTLTHKCVAPGRSRCGAPLHPARRQDWEGGRTGREAFGFQ